ncbi:unnamed protein product, partial [Mesorhabditis belari]|uniref:Fe2OG dioxygenase domain-containing protein n=1 Tax=Mesorhabditis belari TaxID=2138241 RepID=A0AAF3EWA1_9BILA
MTLEQMITVQSTNQSMREANGTWIAHGKTLKFAALFSALQNLLPLFDLRRSEPFQVINYNRGGHYAPHYDYPTDEKTQKVMEKRGNRIATVIVVLKRAEKGGGLVFTELKTSLLPDVGDVILWFNMTSRHQLEYLSKHAACPVERGRKIVISLWIRSKGQEFTLKSRNSNGFDFRDFN